MESSPLASQNLFGFVDLKTSRGSHLADRTHGPKFFSSNRRRELKPLNARSRNAKRGKNAAASSLAIVRKDEALDLRLAGKGFREIARELGCSLGAAYGYVEASLNELRKSSPEKAEELREIDLQRLDLATDCALRAIKAGDTLAIGPLVRVLERRAKLLGLDMPSKQEITGKDGAALLTFAELAKKAAEGAPG